MLQKNEKKTINCKVDTMNDVVDRYCFHVLTETNKNSRNTSKYIFIEVKKIRFLYVTDDDYD